MPRPGHALLPRLVERVPPPARAAAASALIGLAVFLYFGHAFLNYDTFYALVWGSDLAHGLSPQYTVAVAPTPHPLAILAGIGLSALGDSAEPVALGIVLFALGSICVALFTLGRESYAWPVGLVGAAIAATRVPLLNFGIRGYVDFPTIALILWAAVLESRRPRRGAPVLAMLALAGLLRPEAWLFSAAYWIWLTPRLSAGGRIRLGLLAAAGPLLWGLSDLLVTGDALWSLHGTHDLAAQLHRKRGLGAVPEVLPRRLGEILRLPELVASVIGFGLGLWLLRARTLLPASLAVLNGIAFLGFAVAGLSLLGRYLFLAGTVLSLFAGVALFGWLALADGHPRRGAWRLVAVVLAASVVALSPSQASRLSALRNDIANRERVQADLHALARAPGTRLALRRCDGLYVPSHQPVPQLAYWTGRRPASVISVGSQSPPPAGGLYIGPTDSGVARLSVLDPRDPRPLGGFPPGQGPPGYRVLVRNRSWLLYGRCR
ncbi:MAG: hypothetical protein NVSMB25_23730 [Thermoleophilaceae bacterium]